MISGVFGGDVEAQAMTQEPLAPIHLSPTKTNTNVNHSNSFVWRFLIFLHAHTPISFRLGIYRSLA
jgi:hypothetical protein